MALLEHFTVLAENQVKCTLCDDVIEDGDLLEAHLHDKKHKELYMKHLMDSNSIFISTSGIFCDVCNCSVEIVELTTHVRSKDHQSKVYSIKELVVMDGDFVELPGKNKRHTPHCMVCDKELKFTHIKDHLSSDTHRYLRAMIIQPLNGIFSVEGTDKLLWCKICQIYFDNYIEIIFRHVEQTDHAKKMAKFMRLIDGQNVDIDNYLQNIKNDKAYCRKCKIEVPCNVDNLQSHVRGKKHKSVE